MSLIQLVEAVDRRVKKMDAKQDGLADLLEQNLASINLQLASPFLIFSNLLLYFASFIRLLARSVNEPVIISSFSITFPLVMPTIEIA